MIYEKNTSLFKLDCINCRVDAVVLSTASDYSETPVTVTASYMCKSADGRIMLNETKGNIFFITDYDNEFSTVIITFAADFEVPSLYINGGEVYLNAGDFEIELLKTAIGDEARAVRTYLRSFANKSLVTMSNTWGDGNGFSRVCEDFVKKEIDADSELGIDCMQIDDGWQLGSTSDPKRRNEFGERVFDNDFWEENTEKFPSGLDEIGAYADKKGVKTGLWFAPDYHGNFAHAERDLQILAQKHASMQCGFIKLDMLFVTNSDEKKRFVEFCEKLKRIALLELDVTLSQRLGYLLGIKHGIIFTENRYTKFGNYVPCRTLKNLWELGKYVPLQGLQGEVVNPDLNAEKYSSPFAPINYTFDYLFAITAFANPLFWCEVQFLSESRKNELMRILPVWKSVRNELASGDIEPIGEIPTGRSLTGFAAHLESKEYAVIFRENTCRKDFTLKLDREYQSVTVLAENSESTVHINRGELTVTFDKINSYVFVEIK